MALDDVDLQDQAVQYVLVHAPCRVLVAAPPAG